MIKILNAGMFTTIQDLGREGFQSKGIPVSGAMDKTALILGNILNGNDRSEAALEITYSGFKCEFLSDMTIALTGANLDYHINGKKVEMNQTLYINKFDILESKSLVSGLRGYITILGGIDTDEILDSKSTYLKGKFGGLEGRRLKMHDTLKTNAEKLHALKLKRMISEDFINSIYEDRAIKVILGPEEGRFTDRGIETLFSSEYSLCANSDRMGYRLSGDKIEHVNGADILSAPLTYGSIQVPGNGEPIIMMADRQTTGGYTKIGHVISCDHSYLSQLKTDETLKFERVDIVEAQSLYRSFENKLSSMEKEFSSERLTKENIRRFNIAINKNNYNIRVGISHDEI